MKEENRNKDEQNEYAENIKGKPIYILDVESGRKGYFCIGCKNEMQAVKSKIKGRKSYFRHDATNVKKEERKCTFSNQNYRHSQAIFILSRIKQIKVPALYKYPPKNSNGKAIKLRGSELIHAKYTKAELTFYETDHGEVKFGKNPNIDRRNLLIRPDVTFFNAQNEPILFIEIVVTHEIDQEKLAKIKRLGVDTVQITIPKDSLENIEKSFYRGKKIKWIYNNEQERTEYLYVSNNGSTGISQIDELQRKLFEESFECRKSQISNLIRAIAKCLGSEQYKRIEREFGKEIQRTERNTERVKKESEKYREGIRNGVEGRFKSRSSALRTKNEKLLGEERKFEKYFRIQEKKLDDFFDKNEGAIKYKHRELEERYIKRREEVEGEQKDIGKSVLEIKFFESTEKEYREEEARIGREIEGVEERIRDSIRRRENLPQKFEQLQNEEKERVRREKEQIKIEGKGFPKIFEQKGRELEAEFKRIRKRTSEQIKGGDYKGESEFATRFKRILNARSIFNDWNERQDTLTRNRTALECLRNGAYKDWH